MYPVTDDGVLDLNLCPCPLIILSHGLLGGWTAEVLCGAMPANYAGCADPRIKAAIFFAPANMFLHTTGIGNVKVPSMSIFVDDTSNDIASGTNNSNTGGMGNLFGGLLGGGNPLSGLRDSSSANLFGTSLIQNNTNTTPNNPLTGGEDLNQWFHRHINMYNDLFTTMGDNITGGINW